MNIGDTVRRTSPNGMNGAREGQIGIIIGFKRGEPVVKYENCLEEFVIDGVLGEMWWASNCELVNTNERRENMNIQEAYRIMQENCGIEVGDKVRILRMPKYHENGWSAGVNPYMEEYIGQIYTVTAIRSDWGFSLDNWWWPFFVLELVEKAPKTKTIKLNDTYTAVVHKDKVVVGCQTFSHDVVKQLANAVGEMK